MALAVRRVVVFGAGALGSVLGARLSRVVPVLLIARHEPLQAIRQHGLHLSGAAEQVVPLGPALAVSDTASLRDGDLILLTVKAAQAVEACRVLAETAPARPLLPLAAFQNGTGYEHDLGEWTRDRFELFHAVTHVGANQVAPGHVEDWGGEILLPDIPASRGLGELLRSCGIGARHVADLETARWNKIAFNCALNALSALLEVRNRETIADVWRPLRKAVLQEARDEALAAGVPMDGLEELLAEFERRARASNNVNSMLQDLRRGRPTENPFLNQAIARRARARGARAPVNEKLGVWIERLERSSPAEHAAIRAQALADLRPPARAEVGQ